MPYQITPRLPCPAASRNERGRRRLLTPRRASLRGRGGLAVPMLPRLDVGNCQALYIVTVLMCFTAFAQGPSSGDLLLVTQQGLVPWMSLLRGVRFVLETVGSCTILSGILAPVPETTPEACCACRSGCRGSSSAALAQRATQCHQFGGHWAWNWRETSGKVRDVAAKARLDDAAAAKMITVPKKCTNGQVHVVMAWPYTLGPDFVAKLAERDEIFARAAGAFFDSGSDTGQILGEGWDDLLP
ncbi:hypothetical protein MY11210_000624 [Beauveria gryllotalpidicola]